MAEVQCTRVAITQANDEVAVLLFVTLGRGDVLPHGAEWADKAAALWMREPTPANLEHEIGRLSGLERPLKGYRIIEKSEVPEDRTFRNAWRDRGSGKLDHDMVQCREIHRNQLRVVRGQKLLELDGEWMKATGQKKTAEAEAIEAQRQVLRDLPADPRIEQAATVEELKALWPQELSRE